MFLAALSVTGAGLAAVVVGGAAAAVTRRWWEGARHLALVFALLGIAAASYVAFLTTWLDPRVGTAFSWTVIVSAGVVLLRGGVWRAARSMAPLGLLAIGIVGIYLGMLYLWQTDVGFFALARARFTPSPLPVDSSIPHLFAQRLTEGGSTHLLIGDWNGSDRPPLQAGFVLLTRVLDVRPHGGEGLVAGAGVIAQALWIPALYAAARAVELTRRASTLVVLMVAVTGTTMLNTVFTWPKLMSAAFLLVSCAILVDPRLQRVGLPGRVGLAVAAFSFGMLAHGAAAFALPIVVVVGLKALRGSGLVMRIRAVIVGIAAGAFTYGPWIVYQRFADPPGDRLIKWHLAGVMPAEDHRTALQAILDSYGSLSVHDWWSGRVDNFLTILGSGPIAGVDCLCTEALSTRRAAEFYTTTAALGFAHPALLLVLVLIASRLVRRAKLADIDRTVLVVAGVSIASLAFWSLLMFIPGSTVVHQGSHVWLVLMTAAPVAWFAVRRERYAWVVIGIQALALAAIYVPSQAGRQLDALAIVAVGIALALMTCGIHLLWREQADDPQETELPPYPASGFTPVQHPPQRDQVG